jgi:opacity protein-like surface antigen
MIVVAIALASLVSSQAPVTAPEPASASERAAVAAERAATAAEKAAEAAAASAKALEAMAGVRRVAGPEAALAPAPSPGWTATLGAGLISLTGNAQSLTFSMNGAVEKKTETWVWGAKASAAYGQTRPAASDAPSEIVALAAGGQARADYRATESVTAYLKGGLETDHVKSVELRGFGEAGSGITWVEQKEDKLVKLSLRTDLGVRWSQERRFQYFPEPQPLASATMVSPRVGVGFRYALTSGIIFTEDAEVLPNVLGDGRVLFNSTSKVAARLVDSLSLGVSFVVNHDSLPAQGKVPTDTALTVGLEVAL